MLRLLITAIVISSIFFPVTYAINNGSGTVIIDGEIIDPACAIDMDSKEQIINMGVLPTDVVRQAGMGPTRNVDIYLVNCDFVKGNGSGYDENALHMTFDGPTDNHLFAVFGEARGIGLYMEDVNQQQVIPGKPLLTQPITSSNMRLNYQLRLMVNHHPLRPGPYQAIIRFKVDYE